MNIGQIARNQQMLYNIANKNRSSGYSAVSSSLRGDKFDVSILDDYKAGVNVWV